MTKQMIKTLFYILMFFGVTSITYGYLFNVTNSITRISNKDTSNHLNITPISLSNTSDLYKNQAKRFYFSGSDIFISETYGKYSTTSTGYLIKSSTSTNCGAGKLELYFTGTTLYNSDWGKGFNFGNGSYFCPDSGFFRVNLVSSTTPAFFENFTLSNIKDHTDIDGKVDTRAIFDNSNLVINGVVNKNVTIDNEFNGGTDTQKLNNSLNTIGSNLSGKIGEYGLMKELIDKSVIKYTKGLTPETGYALSRLNTKDIFLYDYSGTENANSSNQSNKGKILTLGNSLRIAVDGEKTIVLKGGNLYINKDIFNTDDSNSLLTIIVKRDDNNKKNGGNVYIDPEVTNIDAVIIAEGSILNYDGTKVLSESDITGTKLKKQLMIYGSVFTRNTIGKSKAPYDSDHYHQNMTTPTDLYDLSKLRFFQVTTNDHITNGAFKKTIKTEIIAIDNDGKPMYKAFAGKRNKFASDDVDGNLRGTNKYAGLVIEYNSNIKTINPKFLQK